MNFQKRFTCGSDHNIIFCNLHSTHEGKEMHVCMHNTYVFKSCKLKLYFVKASLNLTRKNHQFSKPLPKWWIKQ